MADIEIEPVEITQNGDVEVVEDKSSGDMVEDQKATEPPKGPTLQDVNNDITKMTGEFNTALQLIAATRAQLSALQAKSLSKSLRLKKASEAKRQAIEDELNEELLLIADKRDTLCEQQNELIELSIKLFRQKDLFSNSVINDLRAQLDRISKELTAAKSQTIPSEIVGGKALSNRGTIKELQERAKAMKSESEAKVRSDIKKQIDDAKKQTAKDIANVKKKIQSNPKAKPVVNTESKTNGVHKAIVEEVTDESSVEEPPVDKSEDTEKSTNEEKAKKSLSSEELQMLQDLMKRAENA